MITKHLHFFRQSFSSFPVKHSLQWGVCSLTRRSPLCFLIIALTSSHGQEPQIDSAQLPRIPATEPADALDTFEIRPGFQLKLAAHEPDVVDPIAMAFDEDGGLYVIEMRGYSERRDEALGRIRYLEDADGDGRFETSTVFKDGLKWPTGIVCYKGGVFVGATPDLYYFKDTDGDRVSDEERLIFTGFGSGKPELNMQALFNSFRWGPDNRIWGATAANGGTVSKPGDPSFKPVPIRGADFSFDPETLDFRAENGTAQYGMSFDSFGRRFVCSNSHHAQWVAYERNQVLLNPYYDLPPALVDIPNDGAAAPVFRISDDEPWRVVRTRWRVSGVVKGMIEGGGRVSGYFTSATGIHVYWGDAYDRDFKNNIFVGDVGSNLVHRKLLTTASDQVQPLATRPDDEQNTEFLRSRDNWFRPASFATGPDGCLYICDMYREVIEHPWSLPEGIKKHLDLNSGFDRGRIYRVEPENFKRTPIPRLSGASDSELIDLATHASGDWHQTTARRLLFERGKTVAPKALQQPFPAQLASETSLVDQLNEWKNDPWLEATILNSLRNGDEILAAWKQAQVSASPSFEVALAKLSGRTTDWSVVEAALNQLTRKELSHQLINTLTALKEGIIYANGNWSSFEAINSLSELYQKTGKLAADSKANDQHRILALKILSLQTESSNESLRKAIVTDRSSSDNLATEAASGIEDIAFLISHLGNVPLQSRNSIISRITRTTLGAHQVLEAIQSGSLDLKTVPADTIQKLRNHEDTMVAKQAEQVLPRIEDRSDVVARYQPALSMSGNQANGEAVFEQTCLTCHQTHDGRGFAFGPSITTFKTAGKVSLLGNILDPNKEVAPQFQAFEFKLNNGESFTAMIDSEDTRNVTLLLPAGIRKSFPRTEVTSMKGLGSSLMPEGLEHAITLEQMSDLLAYLTQTP